MQTHQARRFEPVIRVACGALLVGFFLGGAATTRAGWIWPPLGSNSYSYGFDPDPGSGPICPGTVVFISAGISDEDTWDNGTASGATLRVTCKCTLSGPGVNRVWSAAGVDSAPPLPLGASAGISGSYELCTPGQYTLVFEFQEISPANDPGFPNPTTKTIHFAVEAPEVTVDMDDVVCCPGCSYPLQITLTNTSDCPEEYYWQLTGNGPALDPVNPFSPSEDVVCVPANETVELNPYVNTNPAAERGDTASITITFITTDACPSDTKMTSANLTIGRPDAVMRGAAETEEEDPGVFISFNDDDDDGDGQLDYMQYQPPSIPVSGEDDLVLVTLDTGGLPADCGRLTLIYDPPWPWGCGGLLVWTTATKEELVAIGACWEPPSAAPSALWVEGAVASCAERDAWLTLYYSDGIEPYACDPSRCSCDDTVRITVVDVELDAAGTSDADEEEPGARVQWNFDQDERNQDGGRSRSDLWDEELVIHDGSGNLALDDLLPLSRAFAPANSAHLMANCEIKFTNSAPTKVRVYTVNGAATPPTAELLPLGADLKADYFAPGAPKATWQWYAEGIDCGEADLQLTCTYPGGSARDIVHVTVVGAHLHSVTFGANHAVTQDGGGSYAGADWLDDDDDVDAADPNEHRFPIAYTRKTKGKVAQVVFDACPATFAPGGPTDIRGTDSFGNHYLAGAAQITVGGNTVTATDLEADAEFPDEVRFEDPYTIAWEISDDNGGTWLPMGTSDNRLFLLLAAPSGSYSTLYETVGWLSCRGASGSKTESAAYGGAWGQFTGLNVVRKPLDGYNLTDGATLTYWATSSPNQTLADLLAGSGSSPDGSCCAWAQFLIASGAIHGIASDYVEVTPDTGVNPGADGFLVKQWIFGTPSGSGRYPYRMGVDVLDGDGLPGQNTPEPTAQVFENHFVARYSSSIYDPSYGAGPFTSENAHENAAIDGICSIPWAKQNAPTQELSYSP